MKDTKLTSVKILEGLYSRFKLATVNTKMTLQSIQCQPWSLIFLVYDFVFDYVHKSQFAPFLKDRNVSEWGIRSALKFLGPLYSGAMVRSLFQIFLSYLADCFPMSSAPDA